jgi:hypothetical protein
MEYGTMKELLKPCVRQSSEYSLSSTQRLMYFLELVVDKQFNQSESLLLQNNTQFCRCLGRLGMLFDGNG